MVRALEAAGSSPPPDLLQRRTRHERAMRASPCAPASIARNVPASSETLALAGLPLSMRKASLSRLLARRVDGIFLSDFEQGEIGPDLFRHACLIGAGGHGLEAPREPVSRRPVPALGQDQKPGASGVQPGAGSVLKQRAHATF